MPNETISEGQVAPSFCLPDSAGTKMCLEDLRGKWVVLYFYPKDNTPGCTREAQDFSALVKEFAAEDAVVLGVSKDSVVAHQKFIQKQDLKITLLSDEDTGVHQLYGVWRMKKNYGKEYMGAVRSTFLIGPDGLVTKVWDNVKVASHAENVLACIRNKE